MLRLIVSRAVYACVLVLVAGSAALVVVHLAPSDAFTDIGASPERVASERARYGLDRPFVEQYTHWLGRLVTLDLGESIRFRRPVTTLLRERIGNTLLLGTTALVLAVLLGMPAGVVTASSPRRWTSRAIRALSLLLVSVPPLVTSLALLLVAARSGWLPAGGYEIPSGAGVLANAGAALRYLPLPMLALALPIAASLERLQSGAMAEALGAPSTLAARARGISARRATWRHAWPLSLPPVLAVLGIVIGTVLSGSFIVEIVMSWPGLGDLMYQALVARDIFLAAGCAVAGAAFLSLGLAFADIALRIAEPRLQEPA